MIKQIMAGIAQELMGERALAHEIFELKQGINKIMATLEEIQAAQVVTDAKISAVAADVTALLAKIAAIPAAGLTAEQQAAIDDIAAHAAKINDSLAAVDASANPAP